MHQTESDYLGQFMGTEEAEGNMNEREQAAAFEQAWRETYPEKARPVLDYRMIGRAVLDVAWPEQHIALVIGGNVIQRPVGWTLLIADDITDEEVMEAAARLLA
ncbi:MAG: hypothetical protein JNJ61_25750 [Anaerolineae bacterium]|nr:hypothetical protein [Anaerolineae bacterium]